MGSVSRCVHAEQSTRLYVVMYPDIVHRKYQPRIRDHPTSSLLYCHTEEIQQMVVRGDKDSATATRNISARHRPQAPRHDNVTRYSRVEIDHEDRFSSPQDYLEWAVYVGVAS